MSGPQSVSAAPGAPRDLPGRPTGRSSCGAAPGCWHPHCQRRCWPQTRSLRGQERTIPLSASSDRSRRGAGCLTLEQGALHVRSIATPDGRGSEQEPEKGGHETVVKLHLFFWSCIFCSASSQTLALQTTYEKGATVRPKKGHKYSPPFFGPCGKKGTGAHLPKWSPTRQLLSGARMPPDTYKAG